jgi:tripartite-type tricarboxylate transporter receptor subunit TctC
MVLGRKIKLCAIALAATVTGLSAVAAQTFPSRPITLIVPFAAGGPLDTVTRTLSEQVGAELGQRVVVENMAGAGGSTGVGQVVRANPDGHILGMGNWSTHVINASVYALTYDLVADLAPVALLPSNPQLLVARKTMPAETLPDLVGWLKANRANLASAGVGTASHASGLLLQQRTGASVAFVHYKGGGPALQDVVAGHVDLMFDQIATALPHVREGALKAYAVTSKSRVAVAPDIPTVDEAGLPGFYISVWNGVWAPKGTPPAAIAAVNRAFNRAMESPAVARRLVDLGLELPPPDQRTPEALAALQAAELAKWSPIIKASNVKAN